VLKRQKPQESSQDMDASPIPGGKKLEYSEGRLKFKRVLRVGLNCFPAASHGGKALRLSKQRKGVFVSQ
jgi:hypothetical protein